MKEHIKTGTVLLLIAAGFVLLFMAMQKLAALALLVLIAVVLTTGILPMVEWLQGVTRRWVRLPRAVAILLVLLFFVLILLSLISFLAITAITESIDFIRNTWPGLQGNIVEWSGRMAARYPFLPALDTILDRLRAQSASIAQYAWSSTLAIIGVLGGLVSLVTVLILTFFFANFRDGITRTFAQFIPLEHQAFVLEITHRAAQKMGGWLRGQLLLALIITALVWLVLGVLGIPYAALIAIIGGIGELVPMLGPYVAFFPALAIMLFADQIALWQIIVVSVFFVLLAQTENYVLSPKIMEKQVELSPVTTILALLTGGSLLGLVGAILAIPIAAAGRVILLDAIFPAIQQKTAEQVHTAVEGNDPPGNTPFVDAHERQGKARNKRRR